MEIRKCTLTHQTRLVVADEDGEALNTPIPMRPTLARNSANRSSKRKVPPIPQEDKKSYRQDPATSGRQGSADQVYGEDDIEVGLLNIAYLPIRPLFIIKITAFIYTIPSSRIQKLNVDKIVIEANPKLFKFEFL